MPSPFAQALEELKSEETLWEKMQELMPAKKERWKFALTGFNTHDSSEQFNDSMQAVDESEFLRQIIW